MDITYIDSSLLVASCSSHYFFLPFGIIDLFFLIPCLAALTPALQYIASYFCRVKVHYNSYIVTLLYDYNVTCCHRA